jgi:hypothetical protein
MYYIKWVRPSFRNHKLIVIRAVGIFQWIIRQVDLKLFYFLLIAHIAQLIRHNKN